MKPHVLVIDDSLTVRMDLRGALTAAGFEVTLCETKRAAEGLLDQKSFNAVVLDVMLPDGDGVEILRRIRSSPDHANMPVIMLSSEAEVRDRIRGLSMGANEYVGKPYNIAYFIRCLRGLCRSGRASAAPPVAIVGCRRILAVDDSPTFLACLGRMLRDDGHDVVFARSGREALDMLAAQTIDCVIVDLIMPDVDGLETVRRIRQTPGRESTPTLILTASENPQDQRNATAAGADEFVIKAATLDVVRAKVHHLLRRKHREIPRVETSSPPPHRSVFPVKSEDAPVSTRTLMLQVKPSAATTRTELKTVPKFGPLFLEVVTAIGLDAERTRDMLARTLARLNIDPSTMNQQDLSRALPALRETIAMFFTTDEVGPRIHALTTLATRSRVAAA